MDHTALFAIVDVTIEDLALNSAVTYPIIPAMQSTSLRIKKTNQILRCRVPQVPVLHLGLLSVLLLRS